jgi:hypothetical protein
MSNISKDQIKERLLKQTAKIWGVDEFGLEASFDPIISLLYDALSHELVKISDSIKSSRTRITERLVDLLTPELSTLVKPAHAIMHCVPIESREIVTEFNQFLYRKREEVVDIRSNKMIKDYYFSPTGNFDVSNCNIKYIVGQKKVTVFDQLRMNDFIDAERSYLKSPDFNTFWLGIQAHKELDSLENVMLYFNSTGSTKKEQFLNNLVNSKWEMGGNKLKVKKGYNIKNKPIVDYKNYINESIQTKLPFYYAEINSFHKKYFITINDSSSIQDIKMNYPEELKKFIQQESLEKFDEKLVWIKVSMSPIIDQQVINNLHCYTNCFPVINKKLIHITQRSQKQFNIIPLEINDDYFLDIQQIDTSEGKEYLTKDRDKFQNNENLKAYLRYGGVARFDERDASELIHHLLDVLKEDSVAYKAIGDDFINNNVTQLRQIISSIEQKVEKKRFIKTKSPYLIIDQDKFKKNYSEAFFISYWVSNGASANKIHPFVNLSQYKGSAFQNQSIKFVTGTMGGVDEPKPSEKVYAYRENVLSKGRIVTNQDIINHCYNLFKNSISDVEIKKGVQVQQGTVVGYTPTVDVYITKSNEAIFDENDWQYLKESLINTLKIKSANVLPFRIFYK